MVSPSPNPTLQFVLSLMGLAELTCQGWFMLGVNRGRLVVWKQPAATCDGATSILCFN